MNNKVEKLRALCYSKEDIKNIPDIAGEFSDLEIEFIEQFKRVYEFGGDQVSIFMDMLNEGGYQLDVYTIMYYVDLLKNGPMRQYFYNYRGNKRYYHPLPDVMGTLTNENKSPSNVTVISGDALEVGCSVEIRKRLPPRMKYEMDKAIPLCEQMFRSSLRSSTVHDNTLPLIDKKPESRCNSEPSGKWPLRPNANYMVKDIDWYNIVVAAKPEVLLVVWLYLSLFQQTEELFKPDLTPPVGVGPGEENWRVWNELRNYNPFEENESTSSDYIHTKTVEGDGQKINLDVDLFGEELESFKKRGTALKIINEDKDIEYKLYTNQGQMGS
jgi:hypothetical protein